MTRKRLITIGVLVVVGVVAVSSQPVKDLRMCYDVRSASDKFPDFQLPGAGVSVTAVEDGIVTLDAGTFPTEIATAISDGKPLETLIGLDPRIKGMSEFEKMIRWRDGVSDVRWFATSPGQGSGTNICGQ